jgi:hypothetical protein
MKKSEAERAADATRRAIARITKPKKRRSSEPSFKILGETGPRDSVYFEEYAPTEPVIFDKRSSKWRANGKWVTR